MHCATEPDPGVWSVQQASCIQPKTSVPRVCCGPGGRADGSWCRGKRFRQLTDRWVPAVDEHGQPQATLEIPARGLGVSKPDDIVRAARIARREVNKTRAAAKPCRTHRGQIPSIRSQPNVPRGPGQVHTPAQHRNKSQSEPAPRTATPESERPNCIHPVTSPRGFKNHKRNP